MGIGYRIKEARERLALTQTELGQKVGVTGSAITNYEKETSHPKEQVIYKLMEVLGVDANYLFQDCMSVNPNTHEISLSEYEHIKKYRALDDHGRKMVDFTLKEEWERSNYEKNYNIRPISNMSMVAEDKSDYGVNAAHKRTDIDFPEGTDTSDNDIMDDENF